MEMLAAPCKERVGNVVIGRVGIHGVQAIL